MKSLITGKLPPLNFGELKSDSKICRSIVVKIDCTTLSNNRFSLRYGKIKMSHSIHILNIQFDILSHSIQMLSIQFDTLSHFIHMLIIQFDALSHSIHVVIIQFDILSHSIHMLSIQFDTFKTLT